MTGERFVCHSNSGIVLIVLTGAALVGVLVGWEPAYGMLGVFLVGWVVEFSRSWSGTVLVVDAQGLHTDSARGKRRLSIAWADIRSLEVQLVEPAMLTINRKDYCAHTIGLSDFGKSADILAAIRRQGGVEPVVLAPPPEIGTLPFLVMMLAIPLAVATLHIKLTQLLAWHAGSEPRGLLFVLVLLLTVALMWLGARGTGKGRPWRVALVTGLVVAPVLTLALLTANRWHTEQRPLSVDTVLLRLERGNVDSQQWRAVVTDADLGERPLRINGGWSGYESGLQVGAVYRVGVWRGWLGDVAIRPGTFAVAWSGEEEVQ